MEILLQLVYSGISLGMIYAVIAFGVSVDLRDVWHLNFGQGEALMLGALVGLTCATRSASIIGSWCPSSAHSVRSKGQPWSFSAFDPRSKSKSEFGWIMSTIALGIIFKSRRGKRVGPR